MMRDLYPEIEPNFSDFLLTDSNNKIYYEECGTSSGIPVLFLHGGPGSGCNENHRRYFNPEKYRIIIFDQPGCNRSQTDDNLTDNTTDEILSVINLLRLKLGIEQWLLFGGSWGSTLALLYAEQFPEHVNAMILRGSFLARKQDLQWFLKDGVGRIFPDYWQEFSESVLRSVDDDPVDALAELVFSEDYEQQLRASIAWGTWAGRIVTSSITSEYELKVEDEKKLINETQIEMHYARNRYFLTENQILKNIKNIGRIPITILHGRRDLTCLPESSYLLHRCLPDSILKIIPETGHLASEPGMIDALVIATDNMIDVLR